MDAYLSGVRLAEGKGQLISDLLYKWISEDDPFIPSIIYLLLSKVFEIFNDSLICGRSVNTLQPYLTRF